MDLDAIRSTFFYSHFKDLEVNLLVHLFCLYKTGHVTLFIKRFYSLNVYIHELLHNFVNQNLQSTSVAIMVMIVSCYN